MNTFNATLVKGQTYFLGNKRFDVNVAVPVTDEEKRLLDADPAARRVGGEDEEGKPTMTTEPISRFKFTPVGGKKEAPAAAPSTQRTRARAGAQAPAPASPASSETDGGEGGEEDGETKPE